jgi:hypothetical protein
MRLAAAFEEQFGIRPFEGLWFAPRARPAVSVNTQ